MDLEGVHSQEKLSVLHWKWSHLQEKNRLWVHVFPPCFVFNARLLENSDACNQAWGVRSPVLKLRACLWSPQIFLWLWRGCTTSWLTHQHDSAVVHKLHSVHFPVRGWLKAFSFFFLHMPWNLWLLAKSSSELANNTISHSYATTPRKICAWRIFKVCCTSSFGWGRGSIWVVVGFPNGGFW